MGEGEIVVHEYVLTDKQLDALADRLSAKVADLAAKRAVEIMYASVGQKAIAHLIRLIGFVTVCALVFLAGKNAIHPP